MGFSIETALIVPVCLVIICLALAETVPICVAYQDFVETEVRSIETLAPSDHLYHFVKSKREEQTENYFWGSGQKALETLANLSSIPNYFR